MTTWFRIAFDGAKSHVAPQTLVVPLIADMMERRLHVENFETRYGKDHARAMDGNPCVTGKWAFDMGGPCYQHEPREIVTVDGLAVEVPCFQWDLVTKAIELLEQRTFADGQPYFKLLLWIHATVMTPTQRSGFLTAMRELQPKAIGRYAQFEAELKQLREDKERNTAEAHQ